MNNPIKESGYIPSFSFLKHLSHRTGGNPEKALHYWLNRKSDYEKEHNGNILEECAFMPDDIFEKKYRVISSSFPGEDTASYKFLKSYAQTGSIEESKINTGIRLKIDTIKEKLQNGWGECLQAINGEFSPLTQAEYDTCMIVRDKIRNHWLFKDVLKGGYIYQKEINGSHLFENENGIVSQSYRGYADIIKPGKIVIDMKTTNSINAFYRQGMRGLNHAQLTMYGDAEGCTQFAFFVIEDRAPYSCNVFWLEEDKLEEGRDIYQNMLKAFYKANTENLWNTGDEFYHPAGRYFEFER